MEQLEREMLQKLIDRVERFHDEQIASNIGIAKQISNVDVTNAKQCGDIKYLTEAIARIETRQGQLEECLHGCQTGRMECQQGFNGRLKELESAKKQNAKLLAWGLLFLGTLTFAANFAGNLWRWMKGL